MRCPTTKIHSEAHSAALCCRSGCHATCCGTPSIPYRRWPGTPAAIIQEPSSPPPSFLGSSPPVLFLLVLVKGTLSGAGFIVVFGYIPLPNFPSLHFSVSFCAFFLLFLALQNHSLGFCCCVCFEPLLPCFTLDHTSRQPSFLSLSPFQTKKSIQIALHHPCFWTSLRPVLSRHHSLLLVLGTFLPLFYQPPTYNTQLQFQAVDKTYHTMSAVTHSPTSGDLIPDDKDAALQNSTASTAAYNTSPVSESTQESSPPSSDITNDETQSTTADDMLSIHSKESDSLMAPALPAKSAMRASRLLATLPDKLAEDRPVLTAAAPHILYLSSEEDASSSADEYSDFDDFDSDNESTSSKHSRKPSYEDTARIVSVIFSGKPSMITLAPRSNSTTTLQPRNTSLHRTSTVPALWKERSNSTTSSNGFPHPPRSSSMVTGTEQKRSTFLRVDPFASKPDSDDAERPKTPKTPTAMFRRTLSLVKKRSKPSLNQSLSMREGEVSRMEQVGEEDEDIESQTSESSKGASESVSYHEIVKLAKKNAKSAPQSAPPQSPNSAKERIFSMSRRMSVRV